MRLLACVLALGAGTLVLGLGCTQNGLGEDGCWPEPNLCQIVCQSVDPIGCSLQGVLTTLPTTLSPTDSPAPTADPPPATTPPPKELDDFCDSSQITMPSNMAALTKEACETACSNQDGKKKGGRCRYWRYDEVTSRGQLTKTCSLMKDGQCTAFQPCAEGAEGHHCYIGDLGCPDEEGPPIQEGTWCKAPIEYVRDHVHWSCYHPSEGPVSAYDPTIEALPPGTQCTTTHKCSSWTNMDDVGARLYRKLKVTCDGDDGVWVFDPAAGGKKEDYIPVLGTAPVLVTTTTPPPQVIGKDIDDPTLDGTKAIKEPSCTGGGVTLRIPKTNIQLPGVELICDIPVTPDDTNFDILAPNTCLLLCDYQLGMTIESVWKDEGDDVGDVAFKNENGIFDTSPDGLPIQDGSTVKCW